MLDHFIYGAGWVLIAAVVLTLFVLACAWTSDTYDKITNYPKAKKLREERDALQTIVYDQNNTIAKLSSEIEALKQGKPYR